MSWLSTVDMIADMTATATKPANTGGNQTCAATWGPSPFSGGTAKRLRPAQPAIACPRGSSAIQAIAMMPPLADLAASSLPDRHEVIDDVRLPKGAPSRCGTGVGAMPPTAAGAGSDGASAAASTTSNPPTAATPATGNDGDHQHQHALHESSRWPPRSAASV